MEPAIPHPPQGPGPDVRLARPTFLALGAAKCGTTTLARQLGRHPQVGLPRSGRKELHFFDERAISARRLRAYEAQFGHEKATGEFTPSYLFVPRCRELIHRHLRTDIRLLVILRDPVDRAWSHYWHARKRWSLPQYRRRNYPQEPLSFEEALAAEPRRLASGEYHIRHQSYFSKGLYADQLARYAERFDPAQIHVCLLDDLVHQPTPTLAAICRFLGVDEGFSFQPLPRLNQQSEGACPPAVRRMLVERYRPSIDRLEAMLGRDLAAWKR